MEYLAAAITVVTLVDVGYFHPRRKRAWKTYGLAALDGLAFGLAAYLFDGVTLGFFLAPIFLVVWFHLRAEEAL